MKFRFALVLAIGFLASVTANAQNLLSNADFDSSPSPGWTAIGGGVGMTFSFSHNTNSGSPTVPLGAAQLNFSDPAGAGNSYGIYQCVSPIGTGPYSFGGRSYVLSATAGSSDFVQLTWFPALDCSGTPTTIIANQMGTVTGIANGTTVSYIQHQSTNVSPPGGTMSVRILANSQTSGVGGAENITSLYDHMFLQCTSDVSGPSVTAPASVTVTQTTCM